MAFRMGWMVHLVPLLDIGSALGMEAGTVEGPMLGISGVNTFDEVS